MQIGNSLAVQRLGLCTSRVLGPHKPHSMGNKKRKSKCRLSTILPITAKSLLTPKKSFQAHFQVSMYFEKHICSIDHTICSHCSFMLFMYLGIYMHTMKCSLDGHWICFRFHKYKSFCHEHPYPPILGAFHIFILPRIRGSKSECLHCHHALTSVPDSAKGVWESFAMLGFGFLFFFFFSCF